MNTTSKLRSISRKSKRQAFAFGFFKNAAYCAAILLLACMLLWRVDVVSIHGRLLFLVVSALLLMQLPVRSLLRRLPQRFRGQFSLRTLLIATAAVSVIVWLIGVKIARLQDSRSAIANIIAEGGGVCFDGPASVVPDWIDHRFGMYGQLSLRPIDFVFFDRATVSDSTLPQLRGLPFEELSFSAFANVKDAQLVHLQELPQLQRLCLHIQTITDDGLRHVSELSQLRELDLYGAPITDAGIAHLTKLELKRLTLCDTQITDAAVDHLGQMEHITELNLFETALTRSAIEQLQQTLPHAVIIAPNGKTLRPGPISSNR